MIAPHLQPIVTWPMGDKAISTQVSPVTSSIFHVSFSSLIYCFVIIAIFMPSMCNWSFVLFCLILVSLFVRYFLSHPVPLCFLIWPKYTIFLVLTISHFSSTFWPSSISVNTFFFIIHESLSILPLHFSSKAVINFFCWSICSQSLTVRSRDRKDALSGTYVFFHLFIYALQSPIVFNISSLCHHCWRSFFRFYGIITRDNKGIELFSRDARLGDNIIHTSLFLTLISSNLKTKTG